MRVDFWRGTVVSRSTSTITATDGVHVAQFEGAFSFPFTGVVGVPVGGFFAGSFDPFGLGPVSGVFDRYDQSIGRLPQFTIDQIAIPASPVFHAISFDDRHLASALVLAGSDSIFGSSDSDVLLGFGGDDIIAGMNGDDRLAGGAGADLVYGGNGADRLRGGSGRDTLRGDADSDVLLGNAGADRLTGGGDDDTFRYRRVADSRDGSGHRDDILDFAHGEDHIDLRAVDANLTVRGHQAFAFIGSDAFTEAGQLRYTRSSHLLAGDTDGDGHADFEMNLTNAPHIDAGDLLL